MPVEALEQHITRIRLATTDRLSRRDLAKWITQETYIGGKKFSFKNHEFQQRIASDESREIVCQKSAQLGVSELSLRMAVGLVMLMPPPFSVAYVFPTAGFSTQYSKTRFSPIVQGSPLLRSTINAEDLDSAEVKTFGPGRQLYFKGASATSSAISTSLSAIFFDEYSFMDQVVAGDYTSRLVHDPHKIKMKFSTPQWIGDPISTAMAASKRWRNYCKCHHCGHSFVPSFYDHVRVPGYGKHLDEITADNLHKVDHQNAALHCPGCDKVPSLQAEHRFWDCENPGDNFIATGYYLSPFDAPNIISTPYLIEASTSYASKSKFRQFNLGIASTDSESGLDEHDLDRIAREMGGTPFTTHYMGIDLGLVSHFVIGGMQPDGTLGIVHMEKVSLNRFRERYFQLKAQYRVTMTVSDLQPYADLIMSLSSEDSNLYGASFVNKIGLELFAVKSREDDPDHALAAVRQVNINRNAALDKLLADIRDDKVWVRKTAEWETYRTHLQDLRRASASLRNGEFTSVWQKSSKGADHYHFATLYFATAAAMRGIASGVSAGLVGVRSFKLRETAPIGN